MSALTAFKVLTMYCGFFTMILTCQNYSMSWVDTRCGANTTKLKNYTESPDHRPVDCIDTEQVGRATKQAESSACQKALEKLAKLYKDYEYLEAPWPDSPELPDKSYPIACYPHKIVWPDVIVVILVIVMTIISIIWLILYLTGIDKKPRCAKVIDLIFGITGGILLIAASGMWFYSTAKRTLKDLGHCDLIDNTNPENRTCKEADGLNKWLRYELKYEVSLKTYGPDNLIFTGRPIFPYIFLHGHPEADRLVHAEKSRLGQVVLAGLIIFLNAIFFILAGMIGFASSRQAAGAVQPYGSEEALTRPTKSKSRTSLAKPTKSKSGVSGVSISRPPTKSKSGASLSKASRSRVSLDSQ